MFSFFLTLYDSIYYSTKSITIFTRFSLKLTHIYTPVTHFACLLSIFGQLCVSTNAFKCKALFMGLTSEERWKFPVNRNKKSQ